jgi:hypothetical protein
LQRIGAEIRGLDGSETMSRMNWIARVSCAAIVATGGAAWAQANRPAPGSVAQAGESISPAKVFVRKPFTADMVMTSAKQNGLTIHGKMYAAEQAMRMDLEALPGMETSTIVRFDKKVVWVLMPGEQRYMEMPITPSAGMMATLHASGTKYELRDLGGEKVGSYACEKYRAQWTDHGQSGSGFVWVAKDGDVKGFIVRAEDEKSGATNEYRNIHPGEPPPSLFEVPAGYEKMEMPRPGAPGSSHR